MLWSCLTPDFAQVLHEGLEDQTSCLLRRHQCNQKLNSKAWADQWSEQGKSTGCWECGENQEISEPGMKKRVRPVEWESPHESPRAGLWGLLGFRHPNTSQIYLKSQGLSACFGDALSYPGWWTTSQYTFSMSHDTCVSCKKNWKLSVSWGTQKPAEIMAAFLEEMSS